MMAILQAAEVKEAKIDRLFDLVDERARQKDHRDMRLAHFHRRHRMGIYLGIRKGLDQVRQLHQNAPSLARSDHPSPRENFASLAFQVHQTWGQGQCGQSPVNGGLKS
jgi:hypothetical protein